MCVLYSSNVYFFQFMKSSLSILRSDISPVFYGLQNRGGEKSKMKGKTKKFSIFSLYQTFQISLTQPFQQCLILN